MHRNAPLPSYFVQNGVQGWKERGKRGATLRSAVKDIGRRGGLTVQGFKVVESRRGSHGAKRVAWRSGY